MSLQSCPRCGYALAIASSDCRHCSPRASAFLAPTKWREAKLLLPLASASFALAVLVYLDVRALTAYAKSTCHSAERAAKLRSHPAAFGSNPDDSVSTGLRRRV